MKRLTAFIFVVVATLLVSVSVASAQGASVRYTVLLDTDADGSSIAGSIENAGGTIVRSMPQVGILIVTSANPNFAAEMSALDVVASAGATVATTLPDTMAFGPELDAPTAADDLFNGGLVWGVERVHAPEAWAAGHTGSHDTVVAVIDTGIAWNHPDLAPNVVYVDCYTSAGSYADGACNPYPSYSDHGTHVAGTVAAAFGGGRVVGVAPNIGLAGYNVFEPIPGCGVCAYSDSRWMAQIDAAMRGFEVQSMSLGGFGVFGGQGSNDLATYFAAEQRVANYINQLGATMVASSGNSAVNLNGVILHVPGDIPNMINVGGTGIQPNPRYEPGTSYDIVAFYSDYGAAVDIAAPGGDCGQIGICDPATRPANWFEYLVLSSIVAPNPTCAATASCPVGYGWKGGTSMATPHVSAVAGLIKDASPGLRPNQVEAILLRTAESLGDRQLFGRGMVNAYAATAVASR